MRFDNSIIINISKSEKRSEEIHHFSFFNLDSKRNYELSEEDYQKEL